MKDDRIIVGPCRAAWNGCFAECDSCPTLDRDFLQEAAGKETYPFAVRRKELTRGVFGVPQRPRLELIEAAEIQASNSILMGTEDDRANLRLGLMLLRYDSSQ